MTVPQQGRVERLLRENKARLIRDKWISNLIKAIGNSVEDLRFLDVSTTSSLKAEFFERVKSGKVDVHRYWPREDFAEIEEFLSPLARTSDRIILFSSVDEYLGAAQLPARLVFENIRPVWNVVEQDLCVLSSDGKAGLCLEENYYDSLRNYMREGLYELTMWGNL